MGNWFKFRQPGDRCYLQCKVLTLGYFRHFPLLPSLFLFRLVLIPPFARLSGQISCGMRVARTLTTLMDTANERQGNARRSAADEVNHACDERLRLKLQRQRIS
jgi:hypothetical protein